MAALALRCLLAAALILAVGCEPPRPDLLGDEPVCLALAIHRGLLPDREFGVVLRSALARVAENGGKVRVWKATRSAASPVPLQVDPDGDLELLVAQARAGSRQAVAADSAAEEIVAALQRVLGPDGGATEARGAKAAGADLLGTLGRVGREAATMTGCDSKQGVLVSGGGIHRTEEVDFLDLGDRRDRRIVAAAAHEVGAPPDDVTLEVYGVGHFEHVTPAVDSDFAEALISAWRNVCIDVCTVAP